MSNHRLTRAIELDATRADRKQRRVPAVISTEYPVNRGSYFEVLLHGPDNVDLTRAPLPLIESHDGHRLNIGLVENLKLSGGKLRGEIVFGNSDRANELWPDIEAGIVRHISIGYVIEHAREAGDRIEATRWQPYETSLVSIPADPTAGTYRSLAMPNSNPNPQPADETGDRLSRGQRRALAHQRTDADLERERATEINEIAHQYRKYDLGALAAECIRTGVSVAEFQERAMDRMSTRPMPMADIDRQQGKRQFSLTRMLASVIDPRSVDAGYEHECSQELARTMGRKPNGFFMPIGHLSERVFSASGAPDMIGTEHLGGEFIDALRNRSFVMQLGTRVLSGLTQDVTIPRLATSATAGWIAGDGADGLTPSDPGVDNITLTPKTVGALTVLSRKMILQGDPGAESLVRDDFAKLIAVELDRAAIAGSGSANQPRGIINTSGVSTGTYPLAGPDFASVLAMEGALMADSADFGSLAYLTTPLLAQALKGKETATGSGQFVWTAGRERGTGQANGLPAYASSNVPTDKFVLGNWQDLLMGMWGAIDIDVDPHYDFAKGSVAVRILTSVDFAVRHPESFAVWSRAAS